jgi:hypothetical protein
LPGITRKLPTHPIRTLDPRGRCWSARASVTSPSCDHSGRDAPFTPRPRLQFQLLLRLEASRLRPDCQINNHTLGVAPANLIGGPFYCMIRVMWAIAVRRSRTLARSRRSAAYRMVKSGEAMRLESIYRTRSPQILAVHTTVQRWHQVRAVGVTVGVMKIDAE